MADLTVKYFNSGMTGAPQISPACLSAAYSRAWL